MHTILKVSITFIGVVSQLQASRNGKQEPIMSELPVCVLLNSSHSIVFGILHDILKLFSLSGRHPDYKLCTTRLHGLTALYCSALEQKILPAGT